MPHYHDESEQSCSHDHDGRAEAISCQQVGCNDQELIYIAFIHVEGLSNNDVSAQGLSGVGEIENGVVESGFFWSEVLKLSKNLLVSRRI